LKAQKNRNVICFPAFSAFSRSKDVALEFPVEGDVPSGEEVDILIEFVAQQRPTVSGLADPAFGASEKVVLLHPFSCGVVTEIGEEAGRKLVKMRDVNLLATRTNDDDRDAVGTEIYGRR
jgi:hypothetical protein